MSGASAAQRAIRAGRAGETGWSRCRSCTGGWLRGRARRSTRAGRSPGGGGRRLSEPRTLAPPERRIGDRVGRRAARRLRPDHGARLRRPARPAAGPVLHAGRRRAVGRRRRRAALPSTRVLIRARTRGGRRRGARLPARGGRPRHRSASPSCGAGDGLALVGPLGIGFRPPADGTRPLLVGGGIGAAPLLCWQDELGAERGRSLLGFRSRRATPQAAALFAGEPRGGHRRRLGRAAGARHGTAARASSTATRPRRSTRAGRRAMLEAVRALCAEREVPAQLAMESGMACGFGACFGCVVPTRDGYVRLCVDGPVLDAAGWTPRWSRGGALSAPRDRSSSAASACAGPVLNGSGTFDAIAARRAFGDALLERFPFDAFVSKTITLEPRQGNPPPRLWETPGGPDQLDRAPQQGPRGLPGARPASARRAAGAAGRLGDGLQPRRAGDARRARRGRATRWRMIELNVSCPNVETGLVMGADPAETAARRRAGPPADRQAADREAHARTPPIPPRWPRPPRRPAPTPSR